MDTPQSFTARRPAALGLPALPTFQLPLPDLSGMSKYPFASMSSSQPTLTPPAHAAFNADNILSPIASSINSGSSTGSSSNTGPSYQPMGYWPTPQTSSYAYSSAAPLQGVFAAQQQQQQQQQPQHLSRPLYSPSSMSFPSNRAPASPPHDGLPPPPYDLNLPPFPTSLSLSASSGAQSSLPNLVQHQAQAPSSQQHAEVQVTAQGPPAHAPESYATRPPPTPTYYTPTSTPQQATFPNYPQPPLSQAAVTTATTSAPQMRMSPRTAAMHHPLEASSHASYPRPYAYNLPAMAAPIMSNMHNPGSQMSLVGNVNMPFATSHMGAPMFHHSPMHQQQQQQHNDRPFKCDQCQQSFNRNHDLKRHKRIHLAVKPFPCGHCEKSFSRKDALKRHILVKGCGKSPTSVSALSDQRGGSLSPRDASDMMSDEGSPLSGKREI